MKWIRENRLSPTDALRQEPSLLKDRRLLLHPNTASLLETILLTLKDEGEDAAFDYVRREVLGKS